uniref:Uncharacterized protein n=1 Tax=Rhodnius prolixus TaxID=13249 RepID=T1I995_RHOPR
MNDQSVIKIENMLEAESEYIDLSLQGLDCNSHRFNQNFILKKAIELYHSYKEIISCSCTNHTISLIVTNAAYSWSTKAAYKISDFVNSYVDAYDKIVTQYPNCTKM